MSKAVLLLPAGGGADAEVVVFDEPGGVPVRRVRLVLGPLGPRRQARAPPAAAELKVELDGDLLCLEYRET